MLTYQATKRFDSLFLFWLVLLLAMLTGCGALDDYKRVSALLRAHPEVFQAVTASGELQDYFEKGTLKDPISSNGELFGYDETPDLALRGPLHLGLVRYYDSQAALQGYTSSALGRNWMHNFDAKLLPPTVPNPNVVTVQLFHTNFINFNKGQLNYPVDQPYQLAATANGYQFMSPVTRLVYSFDSSGNLTSIADRNGNTATVTRAAGAPGPAQVTDGLGRTLTFAYTGSNLTKVADQSGRSVSYEYSGGLLSAFTDANGKRTTYAYTTATFLLGNPLTALMTSATRPQGNKPLSQTYIAQGQSGGQVATQYDSFGDTTSLDYSHPSGGATITQPLGVTFSQSNGTDQDLVSETDASGASSLYTWDSNDHKIGVTDKLGNRTSATYDPASKMPATITDELGNATTFTYTPTVQGPFTFYDLTSVRFADGTSIAIARDARGNILSFTDQAGQKWQTTRNARGQIATLTIPSGAVTTFAYNQDGTLASVQLDSGDKYAISYDAISRPIAITEPDGNTVRAQYDAVSNRTQATNEKGNNTSAAYDGNNNRTAVTDALGASSAWAYDTNDHPVSFTDRVGKTATTAYDALSRVQKLANAAGNSVTYGYDTLNRAISAVDAAGQGNSYGWDKENRLLSITDALGRAAQYQRDARGQVTQFTTPASESYSAAYDKRRRLTSLTDPLGRATQYSYDARGSLTGATLPGGVAASFTRSALGLIAGVTDPNGSLWSRGFDKMGRLVSIADPLNRMSTFQYDSRQRLSNATLPLGSAQYSYDPASNLTAVTWSDSTVLNYTYDPDNRLTGGSGLALGYDAADRLTASNGLQVARDAAGRIASIAYAAGKTVTYTYDNRGLLTQVADWLAGVTAFTHDAARQLTSLVFPNGVREDYTYDADGRRATIKVSNNGTTISSITLHRDALGRVTSADRTVSAVPGAAPPNVSLAFDAAEQSTAATYDSMGRETADSTRTFAWDLASRLASYQGSTGAASFTYDALGLRTSSTTGGATQNYVLNYALGLPSVSVVQSGGADQRYYIYLPGGALLYAVDAAGGARHFYHFDEIGSTMFLSGDNGGVTDTYAATPYGESVQQTGTTNNPFTWLGRWGVMQEASPALYYMRARYYDGVAARFLSRDPVSSLNPAETNPYQYARQNPPAYVDPRGTDADSEDKGSELQFLLDLVGATVYKPAPREPSLSELLAALEPPASPDPPVGQPPESPPPSPAHHIVAFVVDQDYINALTAEPDPPGGGDGGSLTPEPGIPVADLFNLSEALQDFDPDAVFWAVIAHGIAEKGKADGTASASEGFAGLVGLVGLWSSVGPTEVSAAVFAILLAGWILFPRREAKA